MDFVCDLVVVLFEEQLLAFQVEGYGSEGSRDSNSGNVLTWAQPLLEFTKDNFLPLGNARSLSLSYISHTFQCCDS